MLELVGCKLKPTRSCVKFSSLRTLTLARVFAKEHVIKNIVAQCPLIEYLSVFDCDGFRGLDFRSLTNVIRFEMWCEYDLERVIVDAPNAFSVIVGGRFVSHVMSVSTCKNVRWLKLGVLGISDEWLTYEISQFPFLEYLHIERAQHLQNLKISSPSLEVLCMDRCESVIDIKVNTHNLSTFRSIGNITAFSSTDHLALLATDLRFPSRNLDNEWFVQYIGLLTQFYQLSQVLNFAKRDRQGTSMLTAYFYLEFS